MNVNLPLDPNTTRKDYPLYSGCIAYFPNALAYVAYVSKKANDQHNPGEPLHWAREKSDDHLDCLGRHALRAGEFDDDGLRESGKVAWRALANLQIELEKAQEKSGFVKAWEERVEGAVPKTLYDWSLAPPWAKWAARDKDGFACFYDLRPGCYLSEGVWKIRGDYGSAFYSGVVDSKRCSWENSLEARPSETVQYPRVALP